MVLAEAGQIIGSQSITILKDPRLNEPDAHYKEAFDFIQKVNGTLSDVHKNINKLRKVRGQINGYLDNVKDTTMANLLKKEAKPMLTDLDEVEGQLMQPKAKAFQDLLAYPVMLNDRLAGLASQTASSNTRPTKVSYEVYNNLKVKIDQQLAKLKTVFEQKVPAFNKLISEQKIPAILIEK